MASVPRLHVARHPCPGTLLVGNLLINSRCAIRARPAHRLVAPRVIRSPAGIRLRAAPAAAPTMTPHATPAQETCPYGVQHQLGKSSHGRPGQSAGRHATSAPGDTPVPLSARGRRRRPSKSDAKSLTVRPGPQWAGGRGAEWGIAGAPVPAPILPPPCSTGADLQVCCTESRRRAGLRVDGGAMWGTVERGGERWLSNPARWGWEVSTGCSSVLTRPG
jgi:hypothetical protein